MWVFAIEIINIFQRRVIWWLIIVVVQTVIIMGLWFKLEPTELFHTEFLFKRSKSIIRLNSYQFDNISRSTSYLESNNRYRQFKAFLLCFLFNYRSQKVNFHANYLALWIFLESFTGVNETFGRPIYKRVRKNRNGYGSCSCITLKF